MREQIQRFGRSLSAMVMPNIGAFIAWGLITALFIPGGWWPNESIAKMVSPMLKYLLPTLIAFTAGKNVCGYRGGVAGAVAAMVAYLDPTHHHNGHFASSTLHKPRYGGVQGR